MQEDIEKTAGVGRRDFIKGTAVGVGVIAAAGGLLEGGLAKAKVAAAGSLQVPSPAIPASQIKETIAADVVVVGAGMSGMCAALSALEAGAKTILIEKGSTYTTRGFDNGCVNSSLHREAGVVIDRDELVGELMKAANYRIDQRLVNLWIDKSGEAVDWLVASVKTRGVTARLNETTIYPLGPYKHYPTAVCFPDKQGNIMGGNPRMMPVFEKIAREKGVDIRYKTPAVQLVRPSNGRVTGVIARNEKGDYIQFNAKKGVILATGGYDNNPEMMKKYLRPSDLRIRLFESPNKISTGDGHNMGLAIGADIDEPPHCLMVGSGVLTNGQAFYMLFNPWLRVDKNGRRYVNEHSDYCRQANATAALPGYFNWAVFDEKWKEGGDAENPAAAMYAKNVERYIQDAVMLRASTIEDLARKMQAQAAVLKETIGRYNELARLKKDLDFGKDPAQMTPIDKPPYYAVNTGNFALVSVSGLKINDKLQLLDKDGRVIPGLYGSGNVTGGFFSDTYPRNVGGISHGRAITFGRLAGINAAAEKV